VPPPRSRVPYFVFGDRESAPGCRDEPTPTVLLDGLKFPESRATKGGFG
jgi:hypothetical protein